MVVLFCHRLCSEYISDIIYHWSHYVIKNEDEAVDT